MSGSSDMIGLTTALVLVGLLLIIAASRKGSPALKRRPKRVQSFVSRMSLGITLKTIIRYAQQSGYKIEFLDEVKGHLVLSDSPTLTSFGFFYPIYLTPQSPIYLTPQSEVETLVEVGITSKLWQIGPIRA